MQSNHTTAIGMKWEQAVKQSFIFTQKCAVAKTANGGGYNVLFKGDHAEVIPSNPVANGGTINKDDVIAVIGFDDKKRICGVFHVSAGDLSPIGESPSSSGHTQGASEHSASEPLQTPMQALA